MNRSLAFALFATTLAAPAARAEVWEFDASHTAATFQVRHMMVSNVRGEFGKVTGKVDWDGKDLTRATIEATIDASTINTREPKRDAHLRSPDFFDVAKHPALTFKSKKVTGGKGRYKVVGDLTIRGVTKEVTLDVLGPSAPAKSPWGSTSVGVSATTKINREDFGLTWNKALEAGGVLVGKEVVITIDVEAVQPAAKAASR